MTCSAELQAKGAGREEEYPIHRSGCACRDDRGRCRGGQRRGALAGSDSQPAGGSQKTGQEDRACRIAAGLLRGGTLRLRAVLATERVGRALRCGGADAGAGEVGRPNQDGPARCAEAGAQLPERGSDAGLGAGRRARGAARPGACARGGKEGPVARAAPTAEAAAASRTAVAGRRYSDGQMVVWLLTGVAVILDDEYRAKGR